jgi:cytochrome P450
MQQPAAEMEEYHVPKNTVVVSLYHARNMDEENFTVCIAFLMDREVQVCHGS